MTLSELQSPLATVPVADFLAMTKKFLEAERKLETADFAWQNNSVLLEQERAKNSQLQAEIDRLTAELDNIKIFGGQNVA